MPLADGADGAVMPRLHALLVRAAAFPTQPPKTEPEPQPQQPPAIELQHELCIDERAVYVFDKLAQTMSVHAFGD